MIVVVSSILAVVYVWRVVEVAYFREPPRPAPVRGEAPAELLLPTWLADAGRQRLLRDRHRANGRNRRAGRKEPCCWEAGLDAADALTAPWVPADPLDRRHRIALADWKPAQRPRDRHHWHRGAAVPWWSPPFRRCTPASTREFTWIHGPPGAVARIAFAVEPLGMLFAPSPPLPVDRHLDLRHRLHAREQRGASQTRFYVCFAIAIAATMGIAFSANLLTLFIFYEVLTLSTYPLVTHKGRRRGAANGGRIYLGILLLAPRSASPAARHRLDLVPSGTLDFTARAASWPASIVRRRPFCRSCWRSTCSASARRR